MRSSTLTLSLTTIMLFASHTLADSRIEVALQAPLDDERGYCLDIFGFQFMASVDRGLQAHTCWSYRGGVGVDQWFDAERIENNQFMMPHFKVCMDAGDLSPGSPLALRKCDQSIGQAFTLTEEGRLVASEKPELCVTVADVTPGTGGGNPPHVMRPVSLQPCSTEHSDFQLWRTRENNS